MMAGLRRENEGENKPFQLDRCHALETTTDTVRRYYPKWYRAGNGVRDEFRVAERCPSGDSPKIVSDPVSVDPKEQA